MIDYGKRVTLLALRVALAASFLSAVADRFGLWGPPGAPKVAWGSFAAFQAYTGLLNGFAPRAAVPLIAWAATVVEVVLAVLLLVGWRVRETALVTGLLLSTFFVTMAFALSIKAPLDYSVATAASAAFVLWAHAAPPSARPR